LISRIAFDRLHRAADVILSPVAHGNTSGSKIMSSGGMPYFSRQQIHRALRHRQFALAREGLRLQLVFVDGPDNQRRAVSLRQRADALELLLAVFEIDRIDDALALAIGQRQFDGAGSVVSIITGALILRISFS
jgi:hypothetical protein